MKYRDYVKQEIAVIKDRDPAIKSDKEVYLYPSFKAILKYRKAHKLYLKGEYYKARKISQKTARQTGIEIHPGAQIGEGLFIDHGHVSVCPIKRYKTPSHSMPSSVTINVLFCKGVRS